VLAAVACCAAGAALGGVALAQPAERVIRITARKFEFTPAEITLDMNMPVVLEFTADDVTMGFNAPDFKTDVEIIPGTITRLRLVPDKTGTFEFHCDIFCGDGHEDMSGRIHVVQRAATGLT
jgi:cytochrome c oxidase subunit 2